MSQDLRVCYAENTVFLTRLRLKTLAKAVPKTRDQQQAAWAWSLHCHVLAYNLAFRGEHSASRMRSLAFDAKKPSVMKTVCQSSQHKRSSQTSMPCREPRQLTVVWNNRRQLRLRAAVPRKTGIPFLGMTVPTRLEGWSDYDRSSTVTTYLASRARHDESQPEPEKAQKAGQL